MKDHRKKNSFEIRPVALWVMLICGIIVILAGIYLYSTQNITGGNFPAGTRAGKRWINGPIVITGSSTIITGLVICIFPVYQLLKNSFKTKNL
jgi:H+/Cl- antiporter ClcA